MKSAKPKTVPAAARRFKRAEVDAALDRGALNRLGAMIERRQAEELAPKADPMAAMIGIYRDMITPIDLADFFELANRNGGQGADGYFEALVHQGLRSIPPRMTSEAYLEACDRITAALPGGELQTLNMCVRDYEGDLASAHLNAAFRLGIEIGKTLAGGAR